MRHAILGAGGVGLALGAALARAGHAVTLVMRESSLSRYDGTIAVRSPLRGDHRAGARAVDRLDDPVDTLWVTVKAPALTAALDRVGPGAAPDAVVPLLNGLDHPPVLRARFGDRVLVGAIRVEAERTAPGRVTWNSLFAEVALAPEDDPRHRPLAEALTDAGIGCVPRRDPAAVLWEKLVLLLPLALATTAADGPLGVVRRDAARTALLRDTARETCAVAAADGAPVDVPRLLRTLDSLPGRTDTSLHRDVAAGVRPTELAALTDPVLRRAHDHRVPVPALTALTRAAADRARDRPPAPTAPHASTATKGETS
ncbi:ketopantoate reductase family protein [Streptomyces sp. NPDC058417]|uniref:ketopantoate reductase family protein n=1 Tax=unclassified Streptomyces TaxID=2593676 RepID=UPI00364A8AA1